MWERRGICEGEGVKGLTREGASLRGLSGASGALIYVAGRNFSRALPIHSSRARHSQRLGLLGTFRVSPQSALSPCRSSPCRPATLSSAKLPAGALHLCPLALQRYCTALQLHTSGALHLFFCGPAGTGPRWRASASATSSSATPTPSTTTKPTMSQQPRSSRWGPGERALLGGAVSPAWLYLA